MRNAFIKILHKKAASNPKIFLITGDLGFGVLTDFERDYPTQFLNAGVAEQNMTAVAAGIALEGRVAFTYSIGNFPTLRCLEQIRNDICYHEASVKIVSVGGGFSYGALGMSHHATEDIAIMRALPNMKVLTPGSRWETEKLLPFVIEEPGPCYLRLERSGDDVPTGEEPFTFCKARVVREGDALTIFCAGGILSEGCAAASILAHEGIYCRVVSIHSVKPLDNEAVVSAVRETGGILTIEEHTILGGLGGAIAEACLDNGLFPKCFKRIGLCDTYSCVVGSQEYLRAHYHMDRVSIVETIRQLLANNK